MPSAPSWRLRRRPRGRSGFVRNSLSRRQTDVIGLLLLRLAQFPDASSARRGADEHCCRFGSSIQTHQQGQPRTDLQARTAHHRTSLEWSSRDSSSIAMKLYLLTSPRARLTARNYVGDPTWTT
jgi:hypothetical protein